MNKISGPLSVLAIIVSVFSFFYFQTSSELVYVDVNKLLDGYNRTKVERSVFEEKVKKLNANVDSLVSNWQKDLKTYEKDRNSMSPKEKSLQEELLAGKQQQINNYQQAVQNQIQEADKKATQTVINDINDYVKAYGKEHGYKIILGASGSGNIMYADEATDLTEIILKGLNAEFNGK